MIDKLKFTSIMIAGSVLLTGCTVTGSDLPTDNKTEVQQVEDKNYTINDVVEIYPITPALVKKLHVSPAVSQVNYALDQQIKQYQYRIGVGDILNITVWDHPELTIPAGSYRSASEAGNWVHADGTIYYPYIGKVKVLNKTIEEVRKEIAAKLATYIQSPQVDVNIAQFNSQKAYITGEVSKPGKQPISNVPLTILDAINAAGGITENADWRNAVYSHNGNKEIISLQALMQYGDLTKNRLLAGGDILYVPTNDTQKVFVMGEVMKQTSLVMDRSGMTLAEAIGKAEGLNPLTSDASGVFIIRATNERMHTTNQQKIANIYQLNMKDASALVMATDFQLKPYDIVYITTAPIERWNRTIDKIVPSITGANSLTEMIRFMRNWSN